MSPRLNTFRLLGTFLHPAPTLSHHCHHLHTHTHILGTLSIQPEGTLTPTRGELVSVTCSLNNTNTSQSLRFYKNGIALLCGSSHVSCSDNSSIFQIRSGDSGLMLQEYILEFIASWTLNATKLHCSVLCGTAICDTTPELTIIIMQGTYTSCKTS